MSNFTKTIIAIFLGFFLMASPVLAARDTDSYDGNIFPIYAGNGSLVPPQTTIRKAISQKRTSVIIYYLDDSSTSKAFAPVVSALKLLWGGSIDLIPLTTDSLKNLSTKDPQDPSFYWHGNIPQVVVLDGEGNIMLDQEGQVPVNTINDAISAATGMSKPSFEITIKSFNEYSSEPEKEGYTKPRK